MATLSDIQLAQAQEFLQFVVATTPGYFPLLVAGDFNCVPTSDTCNLLSDELSDDWGVNPDDEGYTKGQDTLLDNEESKLTTRIDYVLYRDPVAADGRNKFQVDVQSARLVGAKKLPNRGDTQPFWA